MRKRNSRALALNRETVRSLTPETLSGLQGAYTSMTTKDKETLHSSYTDPTYCRLWGCPDRHLT